MSEAAEKKQAQETVKTRNRQQSPGKAYTGPCVYTGPDMPGAKQYTVFNNGLPESLKEKLAEKPYFQSFIIPAEKLAQASSELGKEGSALNVLFKKAAKELQEE